MKGARVITPELHDEILTAICAYKDMMRCAAREEYTDPGDAGEMMEIFSGLLERAIK